MLAGVPVLAANSGGPLETVVEGKTGWLHDPAQLEHWTAVMDKVLHKMSDADIKKMGAKGAQRVKSQFSDTAMAERLDAIISGMARSNRRSVQALSSFILTIGVVLLDTTYYFALQNKHLHRKLGKLLLPPFALTALSILSWVVYLAIGYSSKQQERGRAQRGDKAR